MSSKDGLYGRLLSRAQAVQVLFQAESAGRPAANVLEGEYVVTRGPIDEFGTSLALGVDEHRRELDQVIAHVANNWSLERLAHVDKDILRVALYELLFSDEVSHAVAISEAVNLAKVFGGEDSYVFINGVLGRVSRDLDAGVDLLAESQPKPEPAPVPEPAVIEETVVEEEPVAEPEPASEEASQ